MTALHAIARRPLGVLLVVLALMAAGAPHARSDELGDALKAFRLGMQQESWKDRREAYSALSFYDGPKIVDVMLDAAIEDPNPAVALSAAGILGTLVSGDSKDDLLEAVQKGKGLRRHLALLAMRRQQGQDGKEVLLKLLRGKDLYVACQAAIALGHKQVSEAIPTLVDLLGHQAWQVRRACAEALRVMAGPAPKPKVDPNGVTIPEPNPPPWVPTWYDANLVAPALVDALDEGESPAHMDLKRALVRVLKADLGFDAVAWRKLIAGTPAKELKARNVASTRFLGIPVFGQRVVAVVDNSRQTDDPLPYDSDRLKALCAFEGAPPVPWFKLKTKRAFAQAHVRRLVTDMDKPRRMEVIMASKAVAAGTERFSSISAATKRKLYLVLEEAKSETGQDVLGAMTMALEMGGKKDAQAWKKGPDEILYVCSTVPWAAPVIDQDHIGAAVALRASWLQIPVHTVGVGNHPYGMMQEMSGAAGGVYLNLGE